MNNLKLYNKVTKLLRYVSDLHIEKGFNRYLKKTEKPYLLLGGDIGNPYKENYKEFLLSNSQFYDKVFIISGNHEYDYPNKIDDIELKIRDICSKKNNLFYLQKDVHTLCKKDKIILAGCTLWSPKPISKNIYHLEHIKWITNILEKNINNNYVIATHHAPHPLCINDYSKTPNYFVSDQTNIIKKSNMICWIYGHTHINRNIYIHNKWLLSNQYGSYKTPLYRYID